MPDFDFLRSRDWSEKRDLMILSAGMGLAATAVAGTPGLRGDDMVSVLVSKECGGERLQK